MTKKEWEHEKELHAEFDRLYPSMRDNWKETMKAQEDDRDAHRAAVEAGYASLAEYIKKWGDDKMSVFDMGLTHENLKKLCDAIDEQADEIERLRDKYDKMLAASVAFQIAIQNALFVFEKTVDDIQQKDSE